MKHFFFFFLFCFSITCMEPTTKKEDHENWKHALLLSSFFFALLIFSRHVPTLLQGTTNQPTNQPTRRERYLSSVEGGWKTDRAKQQQINSAGIVVLAVWFRVKSEKKNKSR